MMPRQVDLAIARQRVEHLECMEKAGTDDTGAWWEAVFMAGPQVTLWRKFRDGTETEERLPLLLARWTQAAIPEDEPRVERSKIIRGRG